MDDTASTIYCHNCREVISADISYCTECGVEQSNSINLDNKTDPEFLPANKKYCGKCGNAIDIATPYCGNCGAEQGGTADSKTNDGISKWAIGLSKGNTIQNIAAAMFFYIGLYPIGIPVLLYSYLHHKRKYEKVFIIAISVTCAIALSITLFIYLRA